MKNDYLSNKKKFTNINASNKPIIKTRQISKTKTVNVNILLNRVKINEKSIIKKNIVFYGLTSLLITIVGITLYI